jgi:hypothetical protein
LHDNNKIKGASVKSIAGRNLIKIKRAYLGSIKEASCASSFSRQPAATDSTKLDYLLDAEDLSNEPFMRFERHCTYSKKCRQPKPAANPGATLVYRWGGGSCSASKHLGEAREVLSVALPQPAFCKGLYPVFYVHPQAA